MREPTFLSSTLRKSVHATDVECGGSFGVLCVCVCVCVCVCLYFGTEMGTVGIAMIDRIDRGERDNVDRVAERDIDQRSCAYLIDVQPSPCCTCGSE